jgi:hypothetical protein
MDQVLSRRVLVAIVVVIGLALIGLVVLRLFEKKSADLLLLNGRVYTLDGHQQLEEAVAVSNGRIVAVGSSASLQESFTAAQRIDLGGLPVYPGFIDAHGHMEGLGSSLMNVDLRGASSMDEIRRRLVEEKARKKPGQWIRGRGWDQNLWPSKAFPTHEDIDAITGDIPLYLVRVDGHAVWVNQAVLSLAGITKMTPEPPGGKILRHRNGEPTGVFVDNAMEMLAQVLPPPSIEDREEALEKAAALCVSDGLTEVHDMGVDLDGLALYKRLFSGGRISLRIYAAIDGPGKAWEEYQKSGPEIDTFDGLFTVRAIKLYADGALGSRGAALIEPYSDDPGNRGLTLTSSSDLKQIAASAAGKGFQVCVHAIGDRANSIVLEVYRDVFNSLHLKGLDCRFRVEHAQVLEQSDIPRFHELGVIPSMQPTHCTSDMGWAEERLGPRRVAGAYAWQSLLKTGVVIPAGSDFPVENPNPLWGFYAAITRQDHQGLPEGGWHPAERMTRDQALRSFTLWGAYAAFQESEKGSIEPGKWADLVVLSDDIMTIEPRAILDASVEMTMVNGRMVYRSDRFPAHKSNGKDLAGQ